MSDSSADRDPLDRLAEEFVARFRAGERPSLTEYAARCPDLADAIRELFPALVEMEQLKPVAGDQTGPFVPTAEPSELSAYAGRDANYPSVGGDILAGAAPRSAAAYEATSGERVPPPDAPQERP